MNNFIFKYLIQSIFSVSLSLIFIQCASQTDLDKNQNRIIDVSEFYDSAHHWYDINDEMKIITPSTVQKKYSPSEIESIADNILLFQKLNGGWPKNYDMQAILTDEQKKAILKAKDELNTTFDNGATYSQLNFLAKTVLGWETKVFIEQEWQLTMEGS